ncbi:MAG: GGDEF domain-containing protein [Actinomycetota bacterium]|nr:GGDEF domain-containing protein [Actinomycetota bacterium]
MARSLQKRPPAVTLVLGVAMVLATAALDYATGEELAFSVFYLVPVVGAAWVGSPLVAGVVAISAGAAFPVSDLLAGDDPSASWVPVWNFVVRSGTYLVVAGLTRALRQALEHARRLAQIDPLTGALNARSFQEATEREIARARRTERPMTVAYLDLDGFKAVNDTFGHAAGDDVLRQVSEALCGGTRPVDVVGRMGGDEFALVLPETDSGAAANPLDRIRAAVSAIASRTGYGISVSIGAVTFLRPPDDVNALLRAADQAMYEAKDAGKDRVQQRVVRLPEESDKY